MPRVFIPPLLRPLAGNLAEVDVGGGTVGQVIEELESRFPGIGGRLRDADGLRPGLSVAVNGHVSRLGLLQKVGDDSEIHFLPAIGGG